eukprot:TRINITY_DN6032_c0_g1_i1.p1 TRINITY_DN6032_c0_g1~~TRINITY_DN6032_c0_g1_i1.p1  ORF type:complete len:268 (+),score=57.65 TRINITY_DN6032_c0_g1_i1:29-832(+)
MATTPSILDVSLEDKPEVSTSERPKVPKVFPHVSSSQTDDFADLYPERKGRVPPKASLYGLVEREFNPERVKCQANVDSCLKSSYLVKNLISGIRSAGCTVDPARLISCDICAPGKEIQHLGGYDEVNNQVFVCANNVLGEGPTSGVVFRNLFHVFDRCMNKYDFQDPKQLACTEIRKANLGHCTYYYYFFQRFGEYKIKNMHSTCVKKVAIDFLTKTKFLSEKVASEAVDSVFDKCYLDMEPIGRRSSGRKQIRLAYEERYLFGYP